MSQKICSVCGRAFEGTTSAKYCSEDCRMAAHRMAKREYNRAHREKITEQRHKREQDAREEAIRRRQEQIARAESLDNKIKACHAAGQTYAQAQAAETIEQFARVEVPEEFQKDHIETPEQPARRSLMASIFLSKDEREALIRIEAQAETLQEYFRREGTDGMDFPGVILGRILEQVKALLEADA